MDALVFDLPTAHYVTTVEIPEAKIVGVLEASEEQADRFGLLFPDGSSLVACVNTALEALESDGTLDALTEGGWPQRAKSTQLPADLISDRPTGLLPSWRRAARKEGVRVVLVSTLSTPVFSGVAVWAVLSSETWPRVQDQFFSARHFREVWPAVLSGFWLDARDVRRGRGAHPGRRPDRGGGPQPILARDLAPLVAAISRAKTGWEAQAIKGPWLRPFVPARGRRRDRRWRRVPHGFRPQ